SGRATEHQQDESGATYEGWMHDEEAQIHWALQIDVIYNVMRACNPSPGAWTWMGGQKVRLYDARKVIVGTHGEVMGPPGTIASIGDKALAVNVHGGRIELLVVRPEGGAKMPGAEFAQKHGLSVGQKLGISS